MTDNDDRTVDEPQEQAETETPGEPGEPQESSEEHQAHMDEEPAADEPEFDADADLPDSDVFDMLRAAISLFGQEAWIALGVQARYGASETQVDLRCARVAIDTTRMLIENLGDETTDEEQREFDQLLTNLRINYLRRKSKTDDS